MVAAPVLIGKHKGKKLTKKQRLAEIKSIGEACLMVRGVSNKIKADPRFREQNYEWAILLLLVGATLLIFGVIK